MRKFLLLLGLSVSTLLSAQETCESSEETLADLNSITKCSINEVKKKNSSTTRQISVRISAPKKRYLKKRTVKRKAVASSASVLNGSGIANTNHSTEISNTNTSLDNSAAIAALTNNLSAEEVRKASSFNAVTHLPSFSNCKKAKKNEELACFNKEMINHIEEHFSYPSKAVVDKIEGKVWIRFIIDKNGNVTNIKTLGPKGAQLLNDEAVRVIAKLPKFTPAVKDGKKTDVKYGLPIHFSLSE